MSVFKNNTVGLVLGGGGVRGFFHMGVIRGLQELKIKVDQVTGTSIGAVIGAIYAADPEIDFEKLANEINFLQLTQALVMATQNGSNKSIETFLKRYIKVDDFKDLKIPLAFCATDINKKETVFFDRGKLFPGLVATVSIPGVFPAVKIDESFLVDGGVLNNVPVNLLKPKSEIIISDITGPIKKIDEKTLAIDILYSSVALMQQIQSWEKIKSMKKSKVIHLQLNDDKIFILDFRKMNYQTLIDLGYEAVMAKKDRI